MLSQAINFEIGEKVIWKPGKGGEYEIVMKGLYLYPNPDGKTSHIQCFMRNEKVIRQEMDVPNELLEKDSDKRSPFEMAGVEESSSKAFDGFSWYVNDEGVVSEVFPVGIDGLYTELECRSKRRTYILSSTLHKSEEEAQNGTWAQYKVIQ